MNKYKKDDILISPDGNKRKVLEVLGDIVFLSEYEKFEVYNHYKEIDQNYTVEQEKCEDKRELLFWCSRCGGRFLPLGRITKSGHHYPTMQVKHKDGTIQVLKEHTEIIEAFCVDCAKEVFDENRKDSPLT